MADKKFEPHMMYKGKEAENAETYQEHLKLKKMGFGHKKGPFKMSGFSYPGQSPMYKKNKEGKEQGVDGKACWDGFRYAGTEDGSDKCVEM